MKRLGIFIVALSAILFIVAPAPAASLFGSGSGLVSVPGGSGSAVVAFSYLADGGACREYSVYNADSTNFIRVQITGPSATSTLHQAGQAFLIPPNTLIVFKQAQNTIYTVTVWGEDSSGNPVTVLGSGGVVSKG